MVSLAELVESTDRFLKVSKFDDYCPNGLQVEGVQDVSAIVSGVTASQRLIDEAVALDADLVLVHHGYFWKGENPCITGIKRARLATLLERNISLLAYHLPLDQHPLCGNNARFAAHMGWEIHEAAQSSAADETLPLVCSTRLDHAMTGQQLAILLESKLQRTPLHIEANKPVQRIAWCTGAAQGYLMQAAELGVDAFISGEISEQTVHEARESGVHYFAAGHHATERYGVQALGEILADRFGLHHQFIDCDNPA